MFDCGPIHNSSDKLAVAFSHVIYPEDRVIDSVAERLGELLKDAKLVDLVITELASKYYFRRGRQERGPNDLARADRLLRAGLAANPDDIVWISRRVDVALQQRAWASAAEMLDAAMKVQPDDAILKFQFGRLQLLQGATDRAEASLRQLLPKAGLLAMGAQSIFTLPWSTNWHWPSYGSAGLMRQSAIIG